MTKGIKEAFTDLSAEPRGGARAAAILRYLTGGKDPMIGKLESTFADIPSGECYGISCDESAEVAAILNEAILIEGNSGGRQPFFANEGCVMVNATDFFDFAPDLDKHRDKIIREVNTLNPPPSTVPPPRPSRGGHLRRIK